MPRGSGCGPLGLQQIYHPQASTHLQWPQSKTQGWQQHLLRIETRFTKVARLILPLHTMEANWLQCHALGAALSSECKLWPPEKLLSTALCRLQLFWRALSNSNACVVSQKREKENHLHILTFLRLSPKRFHLGKRRCRCVCIRDVLSAHPPGLLPWFERCGTGTRLAGTALLGSRQDGERACYQLRATHPVQLKAAGYHRCAFVF